MRLFGSRQLSPAQEQERYRSGLTEFERVFFDAGKANKPLTKEEVQSLLKTAMIGYFKIASEEVSGKISPALLYVVAPVALILAGGAAATGLTLYEGNLYEPFAKLVTESLKSAHNINISENFLKYPSILIGGLALMAGIATAAKIKARLLYGAVIAGTLLLPPTMVTTLMTKDGMPAANMPFARTVAPTALATENAAVAVAASTVTASEREEAALVERLAAGRRLVQSETDNTARKGFGPNARRLQEDVNRLEAERVALIKRLEGERLALAEAREKLRVATAQAELPATRIAVGLSVVTLTTILIAIKTGVSSLAIGVPVLLGKIGHSYRRRRLRIHDLRTMLTSEDGAKTLASSLLYKALEAATKGSDKKDTGVPVMNAKEIDAVLNAASKEFIAWANQEPTAIEFLDRFGGRRSKAGQLPASPVANNNAQPPQPVAPAVRAVAGGKGQGPGGANPA